MFKLFGPTTSCGFVWLWKDVVPSRQTVKEGLLRSGHANQLKKLCFQIRRREIKNSGKCDMCIFCWTTITNDESGVVLVCFLYC